MATTSASREQANGRGDNTGSRAPRPRRSAVARSLLQECLAGLLATAIRPTMAGDGPRDAFAGRWRRLWASQGYSAPTQGCSAIGTWPLSCKAPSSSSIFATLSPDKSESWKVGRGPGHQDKAPRVLEA